MTISNRTTHLIEVFLLQLLFKTDKASENIKYPRNQGIWKSGTWKEGKSNDLATLETKEQGNRCSSFGGDLRASRGTFRPRFSFVLFFSGPICIRATKYKSIFLLLSIGRESTFSTHGLRLTSRTYTYIDFCFSLSLEFVWF